MCLAIAFCCLWNAVPATLGCGVIGQRGKLKPRKGNWQGQGHGVRKRNRQWQSEPERQQKCPEWENTPAGRETHLTHSLFGGRWVASLEMPEASSSPEVTKEILPEPGGCAGLLLLFLLLTTNSQFLPTLCCHKMLLAIGHILISEMW